MDLALAGLAVLHSRGRIALCLICPDLVPQGTVLLERRANKRVGLHCTSKDCASQRIPLTINECILASGPTVANTSRLEDNWEIASS